MSAKQSQTWAPLGIWGDGACGKPIVRNKANLPGYAGWEGRQGHGTWGRMRKTNPILRLRIQRGLRLVASCLCGPVVQTNPIPPGRGEARCTNKPNFPGASGRGKYRTGKELWWIVHGRDFGKTKPIARSGASRRCRPLRPSRAPLFQYSIIPPFQSDADCAERAKQTQSSRRGRAERGHRDAERGTNAPNKPNFRRTRYPTIPLFHYSTLPIQGVRPGFCACLGGWGPR
jgi:hypothetical protein